MEAVLGSLTEACEGTGLETHPFIIGWYNDRVDKAFHLPYHPDTLAVVVISTPAMFPLVLKPFLTSGAWQPDSLDPLDQCMKQTLSRLADHTHIPADVIHDFEMHPNKRPKVLVQTAGHVAGAARYYQRSDVNPDPWPASEKVYGASVHPCYGGWFALRGVLVFHTVRTPGLVRKEPPDPLPTSELRAEMLDKYNKCWQDWSYRDVSSNSMKIIDRYSEEQKQYFATPPSQRLELIKNMLSSP